MNWCRPDSFWLDRRFGTDHSTIVEWFDGRTTRRSSSGLLGPTTRRSSSGLMVGSLDNRRWPAWVDHLTIVKWFDARTTRLLSSGLLGPTTRRSSSGLLGLTTQRSSSGSMLGPLDDRRAVCEFGLVAPSMFLDD